MTRDEIVALVARLDGGAAVTFEDDGRVSVATSDALTVDGLADLLRDLPDVQVSIGSGSPAWAEMLGSVRDQEPTGPVYELDDLDEDGTWRPGRKPEGWGTLP